MFKKHNVLQYMKDLFYSRNYSLQVLQTTDMAGNKLCIFSARATSNVKAYVPLRKLLTLLLNLFYLIHMIRNIILQVLFLH